MYKRVPDTIKRLLRRLGKPKTIGFIIGTVLIVAIIIFWVRYNQSPAVGVINNGVVPSNQEPSSAQTTKTFEGKTVSFSYDAKYTVKKIQPNKAYLEQISLNRQIEALRGSSNISVSVRFMENALEEESAYVVRKTNPDKYTKKQTVVKTTTFIVFENPTGEQREITAFVQNKVKKSLAIISLTSTEISFGDQTIEFNKLLESFQWR